MPLLACHHESPVTGPDGNNGDAAVVAAIGDTFELRVGETAAITGAGLRFRLDSVFDDQRCPVLAFVLCVWEGEVKTGLTVVTGNADTTRLVTSRIPPALHDAATVDNWIIQRTRLLPDRSSFDQIIPQESYVGRYVVLEQGVGSRQ